MDRLKSTPTSEGEELLSLLGYPKFNEPDNWVFLQYIRACPICDGEFPL
jgi:hypothetical protein